MSPRPSEIAQPLEATSSLHPETIGVDRNALEQHLLQGVQTPSDPFGVIKDNAWDATKKALEWRKQVEQLSKLEKQINQNQKDLQQQLKSTKGDEKKEIRIKKLE